MLRLALILLSFFIMLLSGAQTRRIDSLKQQVYTAANNRQQLAAILNLCEEYRSLYKDTLDYYAAEAVRLSSLVGDRRQKDLARFALVNSYYRWGYIDSALIMIEPLIRRNPVEEEASRDLYFKMSRQKALYYAGHSRYPEALAVLYQVVQEAEQYRDSLVLSANLNTIGSVSIQKNEPYVALRWFRRAYAVTTEEKKFKEINAAIYGNMADAYLQLGRVDSAVIYINKGVELFRESENLMNLAHVLQKKSAIYLKARKTAEAEKALKEMISLRRQMNDESMWIDDMMGLVDFYIETGQVSKGIELCKAALSTAPFHIEDGSATVGSVVSNISLRLQYYEALARCYKAAGNADLHRQTIEQIVAIKDSIYQREAMLELRRKYEEQKNANRAIQQENTIIQKDLDLVRKNYWLYGSIALLVFAAILAWVIFLSYKKRQKVKTQLLVEKEKLTAQQAVMQAEENERKRIAADLHDNLGAYAASIASNLDIIKGGDTQEQGGAMDLLHENSQAMVSQLSDTIWVLNKESLTLTAISDRAKVLLRRLQPSYPATRMEVREEISEDIRLPSVQAFHLFRIIQEALTNALKHSAAGQVEIAIKSDGKWQVSIADNGKGMPGTAARSGGGNGLLSMKKRAAECGWKIEWLPAVPAGTQVVVYSTAN